MYYRLKSEAVPYFLDKHLTAIYSLETWNGIGVDIKALEEVKEPYISYGHAYSHGEDSKCSTLGGWDKDGYRFNFTIHFPSVKMYETDSFSKGNIVRKLMNRFQSQIDYFYNEFAEENPKNPLFDEEN